MPYVQRDPSGEVTAVFRQPTPEADEELTADHPELSGFFRPPASIIRELAQSDTEMVRVIEDVINILIGKGLFLLTDLPIAAQEKLIRRGALRSCLTDHHFLIAEDDGVL